MLIFKNKGRREKLWQLQKDKVDESYKKLWERAE